ncbi:Uncharacterised protein at_DN2394 [Pycnogonum litorale]
MHFVIFIFFCTFAVTDAWWGRDVSCPPHPGCICDDFRISCDCSKYYERPDSIVHIFKGSQKMFFVYTNEGPITDITIENCDRVHLFALIIKDDAFKSIRFKNIGQLFLPILGLWNLYNIQEILFQNIGELISDPRAMMIGNITNLIFDNVTADVLQKRFVNASGVCNFVIKNCRIGRLSSESIEIIDVHSFLIEDSHFDLVSNNSIVLRNVDKFEVRNSYVGRWIQHGVNLFDVKCMPLYNNRSYNVWEKFISVQALENDNMECLNETERPDICTRNYTSFIQPEPEPEDDVASAPPTTIADSIYIISCSICLLIVSVRNFTL